MYPADINIFGFATTAYDICFFISFLAVLSFGIIFKPDHLPVKRLEMFFLMVALFIAAIFGAKALHIMLYPARFQGMGIVEIFKRSGFSFLGAPVFVFILLYVFCLIRKISFLMLVDYIILLIVLDRIIGRFGCLMQGCCEGIQSNLPWAYPFNNALTRHPTQAYAMIAALAIFLSGLYLYKKLNNIKGLNFFYVICSYSFLRFFNEFLRYDGPFIRQPLKLSHIWLFVFFVISVAGIFFILHKHKNSSKEIIAVLKGTFLRLFAWLVIIGFSYLLILSVYIKKVMRV